MTEHPSSGETPSVDPSAPTIDEVSRDVTPLTGDTSAAGDRAATDDRAAAPDVDDLMARSTSRWWWRRPTISQLKRGLKAQRPSRDEFDVRWNDETRLPEGESVHLGGVTLTEAFTPSTVGNLYAALRRWPSRPGNSDDHWIADLDRGRAFTGPSWVNLGYVRRPGQPLLGAGLSDPTLPSFVTAVWLSLSFLVPSVALVCATFTFEDDVADLSAILRSDFETVTDDVRIAVTGRLGSVRSRVPWSRPKHYSSSWRPWDALSGKRRAVQQHIQQREDECARWFYNRFAGRFAATDLASRPAIRLVFTEQTTPFEGRDMWRRAVDLDWDPFVYRCNDIEGWGLRAGSWPGDAQRNPITMAARRADVGDENAFDRRGQSNWSLTQRFNDEHASLAARLAMQSLLGIYSERLAKFRDAAGKNRRVRSRPVRDARELDRYLITDGLDAATITADIQALTSDLVTFRWSVPEYTEDRGDLPERFKKVPPTELVPALCASLAAAASRLAKDSSNTEGNIRASAELRQAIASTRLQRAVVVFTLAAVAVALVSLFNH